MKINDLVNAFRALQGDITFTTVTSAGVLLVSSANHRISLQICPPSLGQVTITTIGVPILGQGFNMFPGGPPLRLTIWEHGNLVARQFRAISAAASETIGIIESAGEFDCACELWQQSQPGYSFNGANSPLYGPGSPSSQPGPSVDPRVAVVPRFGY
jgi:hypothetical protein